MGSKCVTASSAKRLARSAASSAKSTARSRKTASRIGGSRSCGGKPIATTLSSKPKEASQSSTRPKLAKGDSEKRSSCSKKLACSMRGSARCSRIPTKEKTRRRKRQLSHYHRRRARIFAYLGGCCDECGKSQTEVFLEVDHVRPSMKAYDPLRRWSQRWEVLVEELDKCVLRCHAPCHRDKTTAHRRRGEVQDEEVPF